MNLDQTDKDILHLLQKNAEFTIRQMGQILNLSTTPVFERIKKLKLAGIIKRSTVVLDRSKLPPRIIAYCDVSLKHHSKEGLVDFEKQIYNLSEVKECFHIAGQFDYLLRIEVASMDAYQAFISQTLASIEQVGRVRSAFVMKEVKHDPSIEIY